MRIERGIDRFLYGSKGRGPIGKPVRVLAGIVGLIVIVFSVEALFSREPDAALIGVIAAAIGSLLVMVGLKGGPATPGSQHIELARYRRAQRAQNLCFGVGFIGLAALKLAGTIHIRWLSPWLATRGSPLTVIFSCIWIGGFVCNAFASFYFAQAKDLGGGRDDAA